ncbi:hypothetical protein OROHE_019848 [Orobanche hederae]
MCRKRLPDAKNSWEYEDHLWKLEDKIKEYRKDIIEDG